MPIYGVWQRELSGKAALKEAEWSRQIAVEEAEARLLSAGLDAQSEVARAYGVAEANVIIGDSLKNNTGYLHYLWIQGLHDENSEVIYIPTELNLPVIRNLNQRQKDMTKFVTNTAEDEEVKFVVCGELKAGQDPAKSYLMKAGDVLEAVVTDIKDSPKYNKIYILKKKDEPLPLVFTGKTDLCDKMGHGIKKVPKVVAKNDLIQITFVSLTKTARKHDWYTFEVAVAQ